MPSFGAYTILILTFFTGMLTQGASIPASPTAVHRISASNDEIVDLVEIEIENPSTNEKRAIKIADFQLVSLLKDGFSEQESSFGEKISLYLSQNADKDLWPLNQFKITPMPIHLNFFNRTSSKKADYIRFEQIVKLPIGNHTYSLPVRGGGVQIIRKFLHPSSSPRKLSFKLFIRLYSHYPDDIKKYTGLEFDFSPFEMSKFIHFIKVNPVTQEGMILYLSKLSGKQSPQSVQENIFRKLFHRFLKSDLESQKAGLNAFFGKLNNTSTQNLFERLAYENKLHLYFDRNLNSWLFEVHNFFNLPLLFSVQLRTNQKSVVRHLKESLHSFQLVRAWDNPNYPPMTPFTSSSALQENLNLVFEKVVQHFQNLGWAVQEDPNQEYLMEALTSLKGAPFRENAFWNEKLQKFLIGAGGSLVANLDKSLGILGHEYTHAVIQKSSRLEYQGESGALNEHFADLQGASIEAEYLMGGKFNYSLDGQVMTNQAFAKRMQLIKLSLKSKKFTPEEKAFYHLDQPKIRHFFAPTLSFTTQFDDYDKGRAYFGEACTPSVENDNCGVHSLSGIPNRAASLIIAQLGFAETKDLFFETLANRLHSEANFLDYRNNLIAECLEHENLRDRCHIITESFARVGVVDKDGRIKKKQAEGSQNSQVAQENALFGSKNSSKNSLGLQTEPLQFCGWIDQSHRGYIRVLDGKFDVVVSAFENSFPSLSSHQSLKNTNGETDAKFVLEKIKNLKCGCLTASIINQSLDTDLKRSRLENVVSYLDRLHEKTELDCEQDRSLPLKSEISRMQVNYVDFMKERNEVTKSYCGWVSINTKSRNVTIIDNKFDAAILVNKYPDDKLSKGFLKQTSDILNSSQCACVRGKIGQIQNSVGTVFNYFVELDSAKRDFGILQRQDSDCFGINWK